jgi:hypothetical protein
MIRGSRGRIEGRWMDRGRDGGRVGRIEIKRKE